MYGGEGEVKRGEKRGEGEIRYEEKRERERYLS